MCRVALLTPADIPQIANFDTQYFVNKYELIEVVSK